MAAAAEGLSKLRENQRKTRARRVDRALGPFRRRGNSCTWGVSLRCSTAKEETDAPGLLVFLFFSSFFLSAQPACVCTSLD